MPVDIDISRVAELARIALDEAQLELYGKQLVAILEAAEVVQAVDTEEVPPTSHPIPMTNAFRPDVVTPSLDRDQVLAAAPEAEGPFFKVPRILGDGDAGATS